MDGGHLKRDLKIVIIEDEPNDALLINAELRKAGLEFDSKRVETRDEFLQEIQYQTPDLILSDHGLPSFDGFTALALARNRIPDVPFIFVTGSLGEEITIQTFEQGASDYVLKQNMGQHLVPAVRRALREAEERRRRKLAEAQREKLIVELQEALGRVKRLSGLLPICANCKKIRDDQGYWNDVENYLREHLDTTFTHGICPDCAEQLYPGYLRPDSHTDPK